MTEKPISWKNIFYSLPFNLPGANEDDPAGRRPRPMDGPNQHGRSPALHKKRPSVWRAFLSWCPFICPEQMKTARLAEGRGPRMGRVNTDVVRPCIKKGPPLGEPSLIWCPRPDLNRHGFRHYPLKIACLPIPPLGQKFFCL